MAPQHEPVLVREVVQAAAGVARRLIVDCTVGLGGHAAALLAATGPDVRLIGLDVDEGNLAEAERRLAGLGGRVRLMRANFADLGRILAGVGEGKADVVLADLGFSSNQLEDASRGLSFERDGPLDMRLDRREGPTAADLVNGLSESELANLLYLQSQERQSRRIARKICEARRAGRLDSTVVLARLVAEAVGRQGRADRGRIHPATRTFLALRSAVNREGESLAAFLEQAPRCVRAGGRVMVISFQSTEDRAVKESFRSLARAGVYRVLTKRPIVAAEAERRSNPRSRSAKLRIAERTEGALPWAGMGQ